MKELTAENKIKQTSAAMLTLCKILPFILGKKVPRDCEQWTNFLRLLQITFLSTCPIANESTAWQLKQLIGTHLAIFRDHYPMASITPKMHYLLHFPKQLLAFGPLRHHWCMRFEAKHGFFKSFRLKCFKNLPITLAIKHQLWMCHRQLGTHGERSENFLYDGDIVDEGEEKLFDHLYPDLKEKFASLQENGQLPEQPLVYVTKSVKIHGVHFCPGCVLATFKNSVHDDVLPSLPVAPSMPAATSVWQLTGLPTLSQYVRDQLQTQTGAHKVFKCLINECAQFYLQSGEGPTDRSEYEMIGRRMCAAYPNIAHEGTHPWSHFCQTLSQRIRHVRWSQKRKSDVALSDASTPAQSAPIRKKARFTPSVLPVPVEEHEKHLEELRAEWSKPAPNRLHIQALMRDTFPNRRAWVSSLPDSQFRAILEKYPCLQDGDFIIEDFLRMRNQDEEKMLEQLRSFFDTLMSKCPATSEGTRTAKILAAWSYLEANTAFKKGKGLKTQPVLQMKENISTDNRERETTSAAASPPRLIMFLRDEELTGATIAGDGSRIFLETTSVEKSFLALISTYYVTDLDYPRIYCNVLGMLQQFAVGDPYVGEKSTGYKRFVNILTS